MVTGLSLPQSDYAGASASYARKREILCGALQAAGLTPFVVLILLCQG
jgi:hypothetical protein